LNKRKKHKKKRGFATKKEGQKWERRFLNKAHADMNMKVSDFIDIYFEDKKSELKERSIRNKKYMIKAHIVPYFGNALTLQDIDFKSNQINIRKTYYRINKKDVITTPKTEQPIRTIDIPEFLAEEIKNYVNKFYKLPENERLFPIVTEVIQHKLKRHCVKAGMKRIRLHSLRHHKIIKKTNFLKIFFN